tara:strand:+ start:124 stop:315 length:192 start_codon:yes stop_codon:yes gene_type:complete
MTVEELIELLIELPEGDQVQMFYDGEPQDIVGHATSKINQCGYQYTLLMSEADHKVCMSKKYY